MDNLFQNKKISLIPFNQATGKIYYGWSNSPFGQCLILIQSKILVGLAFKNNRSRDQIEVDMKNRWEKTNMVFKSSNSDEIAKNIFFNNTKINIAFSGSYLQVKVWKALLDIQKGTTTTYTDIARTVGYPKAVRSIANTIGKNPIAWLIPCHRVLRKSGEYGGYRWGLEVKSKMLAYEKSR
jgi:AraC family transcriptional regulator of adaptative response/methylated-DNA-[protein]-cysteine methyltransferase|tara:strand:+ start:775 stop:1317 length:543 start_codon:yes stop_codon:yes gene_type:complete